jgi:hypothetical protein
VDWLGELPIIRLSFRALEYPGTGKIIIVLMGKKSDTANPASASAGSPATKKAILEPAVSAVTPKAPVATTPPAGNGNGTPAKVAATKKAPAKKAAKPAAKAKTVTFSTEDIALRAYFIAEHRQRMGIHGDEHSDWVEAERQIKAETKRKASKKPAAAKKRA